MKTNSHPTFRYVSVGYSCCGDDFLQTMSSRYDLERLGCVEAPQPQFANLLIIQGTLNAKLITEVNSLYEKMLTPKYIMALGTCSCGGGLFPLSPQHLPPVEVWVTGCPPRPEAIMNGVIALHEKVSGSREKSKSSGMKSGAQP